MPRPSFVPTFPCKLKQPMFLVEHPGDTCGNDFICSDVTELPIGTVIRQESAFTCVADLKNGPRAFSFPEDYDFSPEVFENA